MKPQQLTSGLREIEQWYGLVLKMPAPQRAGDSSHKQNMQITGALCLRLHKHKSSKRRRGSAHDAGRQFLNYYSNFHGFLSRIIRAVQHSSTRLSHSLKDVSTCRLPNSPQKKRGECFQASSLLMKSHLKHPGTSSLCFCTRRQASSEGSHAC